MDVLIRLEDVDLVIGILDTKAGGSAGRVLQPQGEGRCVGVDMRGRGRRGWQLT